MEQRHHDLPSSSQAVGLRSPRLVNTPRRSSEVIHEVASFSPVPLSATQGVVSMDIGASPPVLRGSYASHFQQGPMDPDIPKTVAYSVNDSTMQLSDISGDIAAAEERLSELEDKGAIAALNRGMYERRGNHLTDSRKTAPPSRHSSGLTAGAVSPLSQDLDRGEQAQEEGNDVPQARFSLLALQKKHTQEQRTHRPLVSVAVEVAEGVVEHVRLYEADSYQSCREHALEMIEKHHLDHEIALGPLTEHLCSTLDEYRTATSAIDTGTTVGHRPSEKKVQGSGSKELSASHSMKTLTSAGPSSSKSPVKPTAHRSPQRRTAPATIASRPATSCDRGSQRNLSASRQRSLSGSRRLRDESPLAGGSFAYSHSSQFASVSSRYLSPAPERPPPPPEVHTHKPSLAPGSHVISSRSAAFSSPAHERLYSKQAEIEMKRQAAIRIREERAELERQRSHSNHRVRGLSWDHITIDPRDPGHRLHDQAVRQQKRHAEMVTKVREARKARELDGYSFQPQINNDTTGRSLPRRSHHDPFFSPSLNTSSACREKPLTTEEREFQECTFQPKTNSKRNVSPCAKRPSMDGESQPAAASQSPARDTNKPRTLTPTRSATASQGVVSATRSSGEGYEGRLKNTTEVANRLFHGAREREERLERARKLAQTIDLKTGKPLFTPQVHR